MQGRLLQGRLLQGRLLHPQRRVRPSIQKLAPRSLPPPAVCSRGGKSGQGCSMVRWCGMVWGCSMVWVGLVAGCGGAVGKSGSTALGKGV